MSSEHRYETDVVWKSERHGDVSSPGLPALSVATPPEFGGEQHVWTPEHYFVAAVTSCYMTTFLAIAEASHLPFVSFRCTGIGTLARRERGFAFTEVLLEPFVEIADDTQHDLAMRVLQKAQRNCFISASIHATVRLAPLIAVHEQTERLLTDGEADRPHRRSA